MDIFTLAGLIDVNGKNYKVYICDDGRVWFFHNGAFGGRFAKDFYISSEEAGLESTNGKWTGGNTLKAKQLAEKYLEDNKV